MNIKNKKQKEIIGILNDFDENNIYINIENENIQVERKNISQKHLHGVVLTFVMEIRL